MGHIRKIRFTAIMAGSALVTAGVGVAMAQGGISANLALSNTIFSMQVSDMEAQGMSLFVDNEEIRDGQTGVTRLKLEQAAISDLCMSMPIKVPGLGERKFQMIAGGPSTTASNLVIGAKELDGALTMVNPQIGVDAKQLSDKAEPGASAIVAQGLMAQGQKIRATSVSADKLTASGSKITIEEADKGVC
ncbi:DUF6230 family protein [Corynebacterium lowii]|uniref:Cholesterol esterase n=1 Tax=Corynebacterium lowii TaxID=1544413 RepID=A0A0Q0UK91_9CORY|nr:DUF6230 family protein [Corynebacterium lowii]KQB86687.1 hypothetical protein Clow_00895 [Corynebacterium lowii]MDP9851372.1 hypothetical protein [Corynebacterium lowii]